MSLDPDCQVGILALLLSRFWCDFGNATELCASVSSLEMSLEQCLTHRHVECKYLLKKKGFFNSSSLLYFEDWTVILP